MSTVEQNFDSVAGSQLADLCFRLAPNVSFYEQVHRGEVWVIIQNNTSNKQFSTTPLVRDFIKQFESSTKLIDAFSRFEKANQMPVEQWLDLIGKLVQADILKSNELSDDDERLQQYTEGKRQAKKLQFSRPWMIRLPLGNPNRLLTRLSASTERLWSKPFFVVWAGIVGAAAIQAFVHFHDLVDFWSSRFLDPSNLILALLIYPILKFIHELGHGLAAKRWGADVVETGVLLILFIPLPYIDVSQSSFFPEKKHRMTVAAAGMMFELFVASLALFIWLSSDSIFLKDFCLNIILIGAVSSIFFNANPLLKFDGYYLLVDHLEIPNLGTRAASMLKSAIYTKLFHIPMASPAHSQNEARWLVAYGLMSQCYRLGLSFFIALYLGSHYFFVGSALALWLLFTQVLKPAWSFLSQLMLDAKDDQQGFKVESRLAVYGALLLVFIFMIPWRFNTTYPGLILLQPSASIQVAADGFIAEVAAEHRESVQPEQVLFKLKNPNISSEIAFLKQQIEEHETKENQYKAEDPAQAHYFADQAQAYVQEWRNKLNELEAMTITSPTAGIFDSPSTGNLEGRYVEKGEVIANIVSSAHIEAIVMLNEDQMMDVEDFKRAEVYLPSSPQSRYTIESVQFTPSASKKLPSPYLGSLYGGSIPVDSQSDDGTEALKPMFQLTLSLSHEGPPPPVGSRLELKLRRKGRTIARMLYNKVLEKLADEGIFS